MATHSIQGDKMLRALKVLRRELEAMSDQSTMMRLELLLTVANEEGITLQQLEHRLGCSQSTIIKHVKFLRATAASDPNDPTKVKIVGKDFLIKAQSTSPKQHAIFLGPYGKAVMTEVNDILTSGKSGNGTKGDEE